MPRIPDGLDRWKFYKTRAHKFSPYFPEGSNITYQSVAKLIPSDPQSALPATADENYITSAAVQSWLANALPDDRTGQWEKLTEIEISLWTGDRDAFERGVRRKAGEVLGWQDLVEGRAVEGVIRVKVADRQAGTRFVPEGAVPDKVPSVQLVWPGCIAWIEVPTHPPPAEPQDRRAWMFADYGHDIYTLDPLLPDAGPGPSSRLDQSLWQRDGRGGGHVVLLREETPGSPPGGYYTSLSADRARRAQRSRHPDRHERHPLLALPTDMRSRQS